MFKITADNLLKNIIITVDKYPSSDQYQVIESANYRVK